MSATPTLDIKLQGRSYTVACPLEEREGLIDAVTFLDAQMGRLALQTRATGERLAVMAALNLAHELLAAQKAAPASAAAATAACGPIDTETARRIRAIETRLDAAMNEEPQLL